MTYNKIFDILLTIFPYEIVFKILITHKGLQHPTIKLLQPQLKFCHDKRSIMKKIIESGVSKWDKLIFENKLTNYYSFFEWKHKDIFHFQDYIFRVIKREETIQIDNYNEWEKIQNQRHIQHFHENLFIGQFSLIGYFINFDYIFTPHTHPVFDRNRFYERRKLTDLKKVTNKQIKEHLKNNGIKGYSKLRRKELIKLCFSF